MTDADTLRKIRALLVKGHDTTGPERDSFLAKADAMMRDHGVTAAQAMAEPDDPMPAADALWAAFGGPEPTRELHKAAQRERANANRKERAAERAALTPAERDAAAALTAARQEIRDKHRAAIARADRAKERAEDKLSGHDRAADLRREDKNYTRRTPEQRAKLAAYMAEYRRRKAALTPRAVT